MDSDFDLGPFDAIAAELDAHVAGAASEGHSADLLRQRRLYARVAALPCVKRVCEIGFNAGHSASLWLKAAPNAEVLMFDLWEHASAPLGEAYLRSDAAKAHLERADDRLRIVRGSSLATVAAFAKAHPDVKCEVLAVDGDHTIDAATLDIANMAALANPRFHVAFLDDALCDAPQFCTGPTAALEHHRRAGTLAILGAQLENPYTDDESTPRGVAIYQYLRPPIGSAASGAGAGGGDESAIVNTESANDGLISRYFGS